MDIPRTPKWKRILKQAALVAAGIMVTTAMIGFVVQRRRDAEFSTQHPPPGLLVEVDGRRIHYRQSGEGDFTFVLESGLGDYSGSWGQVEQALATIGRVFVYDRAGLGWSEEAPHPRTARQIAIELHRTLEEVHVRKPFVLVAHSAGGISQALYAMNYPADVAGLLLIDPAHKDQFKKLPKPPALFVYLLPVMTRAAPVGLPQLLLGSPDPVQNLRRHVETSGAELRAAMNGAETWGDRPLRFGDIPIYVLTAGDYKGMPGKSDSDRKAAWAIWKSLHEQLVAGSSSEIRQHVVVEGASHYIHQTHPAAVFDAAKAMTDHIRSLPASDGHPN